MRKRAHATLSIIGYDNFRGKRKEDLRGKIVDHSASRTKNDKEKKE
jgi:hypothetical protein